MSNINQLPPDFVKTFMRYANILRFIGLDVCNKREKGFYKKYVRFCIFNAFFIPMLIGEIMYVTMSNKTGASFLEVANALPSTIMVLQDTVKMIVILFKLDKIAVVIMNIGELWPNLIETEEKKKILRNWLRRWDIFDGVFYISAIMALVVFEMAPFFLTIYEMYKGYEDITYLLPMQTYYWCCITSPVEYGLAFFYILTTSSVLHMALYISCDRLLIALTYIVSTLLRLLKEDIKDAVNNYGKDEENSNKIKSFVATHQKLLWLAEELNNIFGIPIFVQMSFSSIVICWFGFLTMVNSEMLIKNMMASIFIMYVIWNLCWPGQLLADTSVDISEAAYRSVWYTKDVKLRKYILLIIHRAQKPCYLTALGFSNLTLANFSKVLSTAWSYLSLINQMYQDLDL